MNPDSLIVAEKDKFKAYRSYIGRCVEEIACRRCFLNGKRNKEEDGDLELCFRDTSRLAIAITGDAESITLRQGPLDIPASFDVADGFLMTWKREILTKQLAWRQIAGSILTCIETIIDVNDSTHYTATVGCRVTFSTGNKLIFYNAGDNARFALDNEQDIEPLEGVTTLFNPLLSHYA